MQAEPLQLPVIDSEGGGSVQGEPPWPMPQPPFDLPLAITKLMGRSLLFLPNKLPAESAEEWTPRRKENYNWLDIPFFIGEGKV